MKKILVIILLMVIIIILSFNNNYNIKYNLENLVKNNSDVIGIINIPGTNINYPVLKSNDNNFYLNHDINKNKNIIGSVFMDYRNNILDNQINIYAHSSNVYDAPFNDLLKYLKKDNFINYKKINFLTLNGNYVYLIFACLIVNNNIHMNLGLDNENFINQLNYFKNNSIYKVNIEFNKDTKIIVLQTCLLKNDSYLLVIGKLIN